MSEVVYTSRVKIERMQGPVRLAYLPAEEQAVTFGVHGDVARHYGVGPEDLKWFVSAEDSSAKDTGGPSKQENVIPEGLTVVRGPEGKDESDMLADGDVDALFHAMEPRCYVERH